ncbi:MAG TPA: hypothetical protein VHA33_18015 [Candidatus Angelobacter sp.]|jgi:hypothetical protein|nr:hypothetical protein [Candidatus Angelobacter sp.]
MSLTFQQVVFAMPLIPVILNGAREKLTTTLLVREVKDPDHVSV